MWVVAGPDGDGGSGGLRVQRGCSRARGNGVTDCPYFKQSQGITLSQFWSGICSNYDRYESGVFSL